MGAKVIRRARDLLERVQRWACFAKGSAAEPELIELLDSFDPIIDAAEVAIADDYDPPPVVVDTREQRPFSPFLWQKGKREYLPPERQCLEEGDYTTPTLRDHVRIERKSIPDLYGSLFGSSTDALGEVAPNQERLRAEFLRLSKYARAYFVIEGDASDLVEYIRDSRRRVDPIATIQLVESLAFDYGVQLRWFSSHGRDEHGQTWHHPRYARERAEWFVGYILARGHAQATNKTEAKKARKRGLELPWLWRDA